MNRENPDGESNEEEHEMTMRRLYFLGGVGVTLLTAIIIRLLSFALADPQELMAEQQRAIAEASGAPESEITCILLAPSLNEQAWADLVHTWGPLDYVEGRVVDNRGNIIGYSDAEDGDLWNLPECLTEG